MESEESNSRLSRIETLWSIVRKSQTDDDRAVSAQQELLERYGQAIKRYLLAAVRDQHVADDLFQEFALKFVQGKFQSVDPSKGQFRSFVKTVLYRMIAQHYRKQAVRKEDSLPDEQLLEAGGVEADEEQFISVWREDLINRTWQALSDHERDTGVNYNTILRLRVASPTMSTDDLAVAISSVEATQIRNLALDCLTEAIRVEPEIVKKSSTGPIADQERDRRSHWLAYWKRSLYLGSVRGAALKKLPEDEQAKWAELWESYERVVKEFNTERK